MKTAHIVRVLGREISVRSSAPAERVQAIETYVNENLQKIGSALKSGDAQLVLTLTLLNTVEEMFTLQDQQEADRVFEAKLHDLVAKLETV